MKLSYLLVRQRVKSNILMKIIPHLHILIMLCIASITVYSSLDCIRLFRHITATAIVLQFLLYYAIK